MPPRAKPALQTRQHCRRPATTPTTACVTSAMAPSRERLQTAHCAQVLLLTSTSPATSTASRAPTTACSCQQAHTSNRRVSATKDTRVQAARAMASAKRANPGFTNQVPALQRARRVASTKRRRRHLFLSTPACVILLRTSQTQTTLRLASLRAMPEKHSTLPTAAATVSIATPAHTRQLAELILARPVPRPTHDRQPNPRLPTHASALRTLLQWTPTRCSSSKPSVRPPIST